MTRSCFAFAASEFVPLRATVLFGFFWRALRAAIDGLCGRDTTANASGLFLDTVTGDRLVNCCSFQRIHVERCRGILLSIFSLALALFSLSASMDDIVKNHLRFKDAAVKYLTMYTRDESSLKKITSKPPFRRYRVIYIQPGYK